MIVASAALAGWLALLPLLAAADWLDEMPDVARVVKAAREQYAVDEVGYPGLKGDQEFLASRIAGTFLLLRTLIESGDEGVLSAQRRARKETIAVAYMRIEYALGLGAGTRDPRFCESKDKPSRFATLAECRRGMFKLYVENGRAGSIYHQKILARLFCDDWKQHYERLQRRNARNDPQSAGVTLTLPDGSKPTSAAVCQPFGGDANSNGLCDAWERPLATSAAAACVVPDAERQAQCKPTPVPLYAQFKRDYKAGRATGSYGPFDTAHQAAEAAEPTARAFGDDYSYRVGWFREVVGYIIRRRSGDRKYYVTRFELGPVSTADSSVGSAPGAGDIQLSNSLTNSFTGSCERSEDFDLVAIFHTHPTYFCEDNNFFSDQDWAQAHKDRNDTWAGKYEGLYLFRPDRCIDFIDGTSATPDDRKVRRVPSAQCSPQPDRGPLCRAAQRLARGVRGGSSGSE